MRRRARTRRAPRSAACSRSATAASAGSAGVRCATPCSRCVTCPPTAAWSRAAGPTVKNVSGFDLPRLLVGSLGHARAHRRGRAADSSGSTVRAMVHGRGRPVRRCCTGCTVPACVCGTARRRGCCSTGTRTTSRRRVGWPDCEKPRVHRRRCPRSAHRWSMPPIAASVVAVGRTRALRRRGRRRCRAPRCAAAAATARPRRGRAPPADEGRCSTQPDGSLPDARCCREPRTRRRRPRRVRAVRPVPAALPDVPGHR